MSIVFWQELQLLTDFDEELQLLIDFDKNYNC